MKKITILSDWNDGTPNLLKKGDQVLKYDMDVPYIGFPFFNWLAHDSEIEFKFLEELGNTPNEPYLYTINLGRHPRYWIDDFIHPSLSNVWTKIPLQVQVDLHKNKAHLLITDVFEGFGLKEYDFLNQLNTKLKFLNFTKGQVFWITSNFKLYEDFLNWSHHQTEPILFKIQYFPYFEYEVALNYLKNFDENKNNSGNTFSKKDLTKFRYLSLNRLPRKHRLFLMLHLEAKNLIPFGNISFSHLDEYSLVEFDQYTSSEQKEAFPSFKKRLPLVIDFSEVPQNEENKFLNETYLTSGLSVVSETLWEESDSIFLSEKIFKAISHRHPFIVNGPRHALKTLKKLGYQTYSQWINEDYDEIEAAHLRLRYVAEEIRKICLWDNLEFNDFLLESAEISEFNFNVLLKKKDKAKDHLKNLFKWSMNFDTSIQQIGLSDFSPR